MSLIYPASGYVGFTRRVAEIVRAGRRRASEAVPVDPPPPPPTDTAMLFGVMGHPLDDFPIGPGRINNATYNYNLTMYTPSPSSIAQDIADAKNMGILPLFNLAGARGNYIDNLNTPSATYNESKYFARVDRFRNITALTNALRAGECMIYLTDEANHFQFNGTCSAHEVNRMGLYCKWLFGKVPCVLRMHGDFLANNSGNWPNSGPRPPTGGWTGVDYGWAQYSGKDQGETFDEYYSDQITKLKSVGLGVFISLNWIDGGIAPPSGGLPNYTFDGVRGCWDYENNGSSGIVHGTAADGFADAQEWTCAAFPGLRPTGPVDTVMVNVDWLKRWGDVVSQYEDVAGAMLWTNPINAWTEYNKFYIRSNWYTGLRYAVGKLYARSAFDGFKVPKSPLAGWTPSSP